MISSWPTKLEGFDSCEIIDNVMSVIRTIRNTRAEKKVPDNKKINAEILIKANSEEYNKCLTYIQKLALINDLKVVESSQEFSENAVQLTFNDITINLPLDSMVDSKAEEERVAKEIARLTSEIERSERMLGNAGFVAKAPEALVATEKEKLEKNEELLASLKAKLVEIK